MSRYSSDSETSVSSKKKKSSKASSSRRSSSRSSSPKRKVCKKKLKKYKSRDRSYSRERKDRRSSERSKKYWRGSDSPGHKRRSRSKSSSRYRDKKRRDRSLSRSRRDKRSKDKGRRRRKSSSRSSSHSSSSSSSSYRKNKKSSKARSRSKSPVRPKKSEYDADDLLMKLNKAAVEAMAANKKLTEPSNAIEMQMKREEIINRIESDGFSAQSFTSSAANNENAPTVVDLTAPTLPSNPVQLEPTDSYLHPNFLLESQEEKFNRWIKKLYTMRQRAITGDLVMV